jgi:glycerophosphoryl diester phosphodiesterase
MQAFASSLELGMDGLDVCVRQTADAVCVIVQDGELGRTTDGGGAVRLTKYAELPKLKNGERIPRLSEALDLDAMFINIELMGESVWKLALAAVEAQGSMGRVIFSSLEHSEVLKLWAACPQAKCGFIWEADEADSVTEEELSGLPENLLLHVPLLSITRRPDLWRTHADRLMVWGIGGHEDLNLLDFEPEGCIVG